MATTKIRTRRVSLEFLGDEWNEAHVDFRRGHWRDAEIIEEINDSQKGIQAIIAILKHMFSSGKILDESGQLVEMTQDNIAEFDNEALIELSNHMMEDVPPKVSESSSPTSEEPAPSPSDSPDSNTGSDSGSPLGS